MPLRFPPAIPSPSSFQNVFNDLELPNGVTKCMRYHENRMTLRYVGQDWAACVSEVVQVGLRWQHPTQYKVDTSDRLED